MLFLSRFPLTAMDQVQSASQFQCFKIQGVADPLTDSIVLWYSVAFLALGFVEVFPHPALNLEPSTTPCSTDIQLRRSPFFSVDYKKTGVKLLCQHALPKYMEINEKIARPSEIYPVFCIRKNCPVISELAPHCSCETP